MKNILLGAALTTCIGFSSVCQAAQSPQQGRQARVATGAKVALVPSAKSPGEWSARRPQVRELRPRARGTFD